MADQLTNEELFADPDAQPSLLLTASDELLDDVKNAALKQDDQAFAIVAQKYSPDEVEDACDQTSGALLDRVYNLCAGMPVPRLLEDEDDHSRLDDILPILYNKTADQKTKELFTSSQPLLTSVQWAREKYIDTHLPKTVDRLKKLASNYFSSTSTYAIVRQFQDLAHSMLLAIPISLARDNPDPQFVDDLRNLFHLTPRDTDVDMDEFIERANNLLYYVQLLCDMVMAVQDFKGDAESQVIDQQTLWDMAPNYVRQIALANDHIWSSIYFAERSLVVPANNVTSEPLPESAPLDIG